MYFLQSDSQRLYFNIQETLVAEAQKSDFEKYWHKKQGSEGKLKNIYHMHVLSTVPKEFYNYHHYFTNEKNGNHPLSKCLR